MNEMSDQVIVTRRPRRSRIPVSVVRQRNRARPVNVNVSVQRTVGQGRLAGRRRRRRRRRQRQRMGNSQIQTMEIPTESVGGGTEVAVPRGTGGSTISALEQARNPRSRFFRGNARRARWGVDINDEANDVIWDFVEKHCDPCGEFEVFRENMRIPDGAVPSSVPQEMREVEAILHPGLTGASIPITTGDQWTWMLIHTSALRTPVIMIALMDGLPITPATMARVLEKININEPRPETVNNVTRDTHNWWRYPNWQGVSESPNTYYCWFGFSLLDSVAEPGVNNASTTISKWRICADGMSVALNAPSLINQGWSVAVQIGPDNKHETFGEEVEGGQFEAMYPVHLSAAAGTVFVITPWGTLTGSMPSAIGGIEQTTSTTATVAGTVRGAGFSAGDMLRFQVTWTGTNQYNTVYQVSSDGGTTWTSIGAAVNTGVTTAVSMSTTWTLAGPVDAPPTGIVNQVKILDNVSNGALYQASPQAYQATLQQEGGVYMVKRMWEPVFNMTDSSDFAPLKFVTSSVNPIGLRSPGGKPDTLDKNFGVGYLSFTGISQAAQPVMKLRRVIEAVADTGSPWVGMMESGLEKNDEAIQIIKAFAAKHPHAYPLSYNGLGKLFGIVSGVLSKIPIVGSAVKPLAHVLDRILSGANSGNNIGGCSELPESVLQMLSSLLSELGLSSV